MNTQTTTINGDAKNAITIAELAQRPAFSLSRKQFKAVGDYAKSMQAVQELTSKKDYLIEQAAELEIEIEIYALSTRDLGNKIFE